jgi:menaquinol-cytochrome c reductase iron-sulfur subunit
MSLIYYEVSMMDKIPDFLTGYSNQDRVQGHLSRRAFITSSILVGGAAVMTAIPVLKTVVLPSLSKGVGKWVEFGSIDDLAVGDFSMLSYEFMLRDGWVDLPQRGFVWATLGTDQSVQVFSSKCSHLACNVIWNKDQSMFICPCHSGFFDAQGQPVSGPPKKPLLVLPNKVEDGVLSVEITI